MTRRNRLSWWRRGLLVLVGVTVAGCAAQRLALQQPSPAMLEAVAEATSQERIAPLGQRPASGVGVGVGVGGGSFGFFTGSSDFRPCTEGTAAVLEAVGFQPDNVKEVLYDRRTRTTQFGRNILVGFNAWVRFHDRNGQLVIGFDQDCRYTTYYTRAGLELPGAA